MKKTMFVLAAVSALMTTAPILATSPETVGSLVQVDVKGGKKTVEAKVGDVLLFEMGYTVAPEAMVSELKLEFHGKGLTHVATVLVPKQTETGKVVVGAMTITGMVRADKPSEVTVKVVPRMANGKDGEKAEFKVTVTEK